jgi:hypothetical protein
MIGVICRVNDLHSDLKIEVGKLDAHTLTWSTKGGDCFPLKTKQKKVDFSNFVKILPNVLGCVWWVKRKWEELNKYIILNCFTMHFLLSS